MILDCLGENEQYRIQNEMRLMDNAPVESKKIIDDFEPN